MTEKRIFATFNAQAWLNDYAIDIDPQGDTVWDVTDEILAMPEHERVALRDDQYNTDDLRFSENAPQWVQDWGGPFYISVTDSIESYYDVITCPNCGITAALNDGIRCPGCHARYPVDSEPEDREIGFGEYEPR